MKPILVGNGDVLTDATAKEILAHDEAWKANCAVPDREK